MSQYKRSVSAPPELTLCFISVRDTYIKELTIYMQTVMQLYLAEKPLLFEEALNETKQQRRFFWES